MRAYSSVRAVKSTRYQHDLQTLGIDDIVRLEPAIEYWQALHEMLTVDGLPILQAPSCNGRFRRNCTNTCGRRPILALTDPVGDTARTQRSVATGWSRRWTRPRHRASAAIVRGTDARGDEVAAIARSRGGVLAEGPGGSAGDLLDDLVRA